MHRLVYLAACLAAGVPLGWTFGVFARARFHYPARREAVAWWHQALLETLDVVEWPGLFALALAVSLGLWAWLRPRSRPLPRGHSAAVVAGLLALAGALLAVSASAGLGRLLAGLAGALMGALLSAFLLALRREAASRETVLARWVAQLPLTLGPLLVTSTAAISLGYRGESALVHGIALLIGCGIFAAAQVAALGFAVVGRRENGAGHSSASGAESTQGCA